MGILNSKSEDGNRPVKLGENVSGTYYQLIHNGKYLVLKMPNTTCAQHKDYEDIFRSEAELNALFTSPYLLRYSQWGENAEEYWYEMEGANFISLATLLLDSPSIIADKDWVEGIINDLMDTLEYIHKKGFYGLDITPKSILITKTDKKLRLLPPCSPYLDIKESVWMQKSEFIAPELFNKDMPDQRSDIYSIGKIIELLYQYGNIPYKYSKAIRIATQENMDKRYGSIEDMRKSIKKHQRWGKITSILTAVAVIAIVTGLFIWSYGFNSGETERVYIENQSQENATAMSPEEIEMEQVEQFLKDTTYMNSDTAFTLSEETKAKQREEIRKTETVFRKHFAEQATGILSKIYNKNYMNADEKTFRQSSQKTMFLLQELQSRLCTQFQVDETTGARIASEVIQEITHSLMKEMEQDLPKKEE